MAIVFLLMLFNNQLIPYYKHGIAAFITLIVQVVLRVVDDEYVDDTYSLSAVNWPLLTAHGSTSKHDYQRCTGRTVYIGQSCPARSVICARWTLINHHLAVTLCSQACNNGSFSFLHHLRRLPLREQRCNVL
jgi:hypothetical protein